MNYRLAYAIGFHPWEDFADHPPFADTLTRLVAAEENGGGPPFGPALDIGTGSGVWAVRLAERGWRVTGVDLVERALKRAHERVAEAGVEVEFVRGDAVSRARASARATGWCSTPGPSTASTRPGGGRWRAR